MCGNFEGFQDPAQHRNYSPVSLSKVHSHSSSYVMGRGVALDDLLLLLHPLKHIEGSIPPREHLLVQLMAGQIKLFLQVLQFSACTCRMAKMSTNFADHRQHLLHSPVIF